MWIKDNQVFKTHSDIRQYLERQDPPVTLSEVITDEMIEVQGFAPVTREHPIFDPSTQKQVEGEVVELEGKWVQQVTVVELSAEEIKAQVPFTVTRRQARQALLLAGLLDQVPDRIAEIPDPLARRMMMIEFEDSQSFERYRPATIQIGAVLGLDEAGLDQLFITAGKL